MAHQTSHVFQTFQREWVDHYGGRWDERLKKVAKAKPKPEIPE